MGYTSIAQGLSTPANAMYHPRIAVLALPLAVAGCAIFDKPNEQASPPKTASLPSPSISEPVAPPPKKPEPLDPKFLVGMGEPQLTSVLGRPDRIRDEPPALVWSYHGKACIVDLFLYRDLTSQDLRVLAYRFHPDNFSEQTNRACLDGIHDEQRDRKP